MGPSEDNLAQVKRDARDTTLRHFRDAVEDNHYESAMPLDMAREQLANIGDPLTEQVASMAEPEAEAPKRPRAKKDVQEPQKPQEPQEAEAAAPVKEDKPNG